MYLVKKDDDPDRVRPPQRVIDERKYRTGRKGCKVRGPASSIGRASTY